MTPGGTHRKGDTLTMAPKPETTTDTAAVPTFAPVAVADLPPAKRDAGTATLALGNAVWTVISDGVNAAQDPGTYTPADAAKRAAVLKRAARAAAGTALADGKTISARITGDGNERRVAIFVGDAVERKNGKADAPDAEPPTPPTA